MRIMEVRTDGSIRAVELTPLEEQVYATREDYLDRGLDVPTSAKLALNRHRYVEQTGTAGDSFVSWLSDETCQRWGDKARVKPAWNNPGSPEGSTA